MTIIPVIDLMAGQVVHAQAGQRAEYRPLSAGLAGSSAPEAVIAALSTLYRFNTVYVADLDAIEGRTDQRQILRELLTRFPGYTFWLDAGTRTVEIAATTATEWLRPVISSENHDCTQATAALEAHPAGLLSLDYRHDNLIGDPQLLEHPEVWPRDVIIMTLDQVGSGAGPDMERIQSVRQLAPEHYYFAAGGIRHDTDLEELERLGIAGALVATALHAGTIERFRRHS